MSDLINGIHHVSLIVADTDTALSFYSGLLGLESIKARPDLGFPGAWLALGEQQIHLLELPNPDPVAGASRSWVGGIAIWRCRSLISTDSRRGWSRPVSPIL